MKSSLMRTRWAALGAAVAVTFGGGLVMVANGATNSFDAMDRNYVTVTYGPNEVFQSISPCRILDTREGGDSEGDYSTGVFTDTKIGVSTSDPDVRNNVAVPVDITAGNLGSCYGKFAVQPTSVVLNVTAVGLSVPGIENASYITLFPWTDTDTDGNVDTSERPYVSHLNPREGDPPLPNAVTVSLSTDTGASNKKAFRIFNKNGAVDVFIDVVGYFYSTTVVSAVTGSSNPPA